MSEEHKPVDILFIVPDAKGDTYRRAIKLTLWVLESDKTFDVMSADEFVRLYKGVPVEEIDDRLDKLCRGIVNARDISKREMKEFKPLYESFLAYLKTKWAKNQEPTND